MKEGTQPWQMTARELSKAFAQRNLSPLEAFENTLDRMAAVQPRINALVALDLENARAAALASTARWQSGTARSPLDGVAITVKDNLSVAGMPCRWGSKLYADFVPTFDEGPVARMRAAGAVILGKTNVPEFTLEGYTANLVHGATRNPWNLALTPGGSSGGAVAAVASGVGSLALATDGGGSIRRPAGYTGLAGLKPSRGAVQREHGMREILPGMEVAGPVARSVADMVEVMRIIAGSPGTWKAAPENDYKRRIVYWRSIANSPVDSQILASVDAAAAAFEKLGHRVEEQPAPASIALFNRDVWPVLSTAGLAALMQTMPGQEALLTPTLRTMLAHGRTLSAIDLFEAQRQVWRLRAELDSLFTQFDCIMTPTAAALAWPATENHPARIAGQAVDSRGHAVFTAFANAAGIPALALPAPASPLGMPIGLQLLQREGTDAELLALGLHYEKHCFPAYRWPVFD